MKKFTYTFKVPCTIHSANVESRRAFDSATQETHPEYFLTAKAVLLNGDLYVKKDKHYTGVISQKSSGGRWEKVHSARLRHFGSWESYLTKIGAVESEFRGCPRVNKKRSA